MSKESIKIVPFPDIEHAYIVISGWKSEKTGNKVEKRMSFFWGDENGGCEWEPDNGPITKIIKREKGDEDAVPHWFYDYYAGQGHWGQLAVEEENLPTYFAGGMYEALFLVLKDWATDPE